MKAKNFFRICLGSLGIAITGVNFYYYSRVVPYLGILGALPWLFLILGGTWLGVYLSYQNILTRHDGEEEL